MFEKFAGDTVRDAFGKSMLELADAESRVVLVSGDSAGASKTTAFHNKFPQRAFNLGIAEQNMVGFAAGLAYEGFLPYVSTRAPFLSMRAAEQIRTAVCYDSLPVTFVGTGGGYCSGTSGATHWALEDVAIMSSFGNMTVCETGDRVLIAKIIEASASWNKPLYIRLGKDRMDTLYANDIKIKLGQGIEIHKGKDGYFVAAGTAVNFACKAAQALAEKGFSIGVIDMFTLKPIDVELLLRAARTGTIVTAQDHNLVGGLGTLVAAVLMQKGVACRFKAVGAPDAFVPASTAEYLYHKCKLDADGLVETMEELLA